MLCDAVVGLTTSLNAITTPPGKVATGNLMGTVTAPAGTTVSVVSLAITGVPTPVVPGPGPITLRDPTSGLPAATLVVLPSGAYTLTPVPGFVGPLPEVFATLRSSAGIVKQLPVTLAVNSLLVDPNEYPSFTIMPTFPLRVNVLSNGVPPLGTTLSVTSFTLPGSTTVYPVGPSPVTLRDPVTNKVAGTVVIGADGSSVFTAAAGYVGQVPAITYTVRSSDGGTSPGSINVRIVPSEWLAPGHVEAHAIHHHVMHAHLRCMRI